MIAEIRSGGSDRRHSSLVSSELGNLLNPGGPTLPMADRLCDRSLTGADQPAKAAFVELTGIELTNLCRIREQQCLLQ